ncbi:MAG: hypothetical protein JWR10_2376 [Rubritepida sp.]|nr:hypothetical protein [Rubritepida sp.]
MSHRIDILPTAGRLKVTFGGVVVADTQHALTLLEEGHGPVQYIPRADAVMEHFIRTPHHTTCPHKGEASYYSLRADGTEAENAVWTYETPFEPVSSIAGHLAFYPDRVSIEIEPA